MTRRFHPTRLGLLLCCGGLAVLAARTLLDLLVERASLDSFALAGGVTAGYAAVGLGLLLLSVPRTPAGSPDGSWATAVWVRSEDALVPLLRAFEQWRQHAAESTHRWASFDQLVRERLLEHLGATRVRCLALTPDARHVCRLGELDEAPPAPVTAPLPLTEADALGQAVAAGRPWIAPAASGDEEGTGDRQEQRWECIWPVMEGVRCLGLIAVGRLPEIVRADRCRLEAVFETVSLWWRLAQAHEELLAARRTDVASGVLTRAEFFERAAGAIRQSAQEGEPVVLVVVALEGVRALDDAGLWGRRDELVERLGRALRARLRTEDVVGRFSDDRFVALLRRLDKGLGRMVARKLLRAAQEALEQSPVRDVPVRARVALAGGERPEDHEGWLDRLITEAFAGLARERSAGLRFQPRGGRAGEKPGEEPA